MFFGRDHGEPDERSRRGAEVKELAAESSLAIQRAKEVEAATRPPFRERLRVDAQRAQQRIER